MDFSLQDIMNLKSLLTVSSLIKFFRTTNQKIYKKPNFTLDQFSILQTLQINLHPIPQKRKN